MHINSEILGRNLIIGGSYPDLCTAFTLYGFDGETQTKSGLRKVKNKVTVLGNAAFKSTRYNWSSARDLPLEWISWMHRNADCKSKKQDTIRVDSAFVIDHLHNIAMSLGTVAAIFSVNLQFRTYAFISSLHRARTPELQSCNSIRLGQNTACSTRVISHARRLKTESWWTKLVIWENFVKVGNVSNTF